jgi:hypothetical protein
MARVDDEIDDLVEPGIVRNSAIPVEWLWCERCEEHRPAKEFVGLVCKDCRALVSRQKYALDPLAHRERALLRDFDLTLDQYDILFRAQDGKCAICDAPQEQLTCALAVDHDHATGEIRGLLCGPCNKGLGLFRDNPAYLLSAIQYLKFCTLERVLEHK